MVTAGQIVSVHVYIQIILTMPPKALDQSAIDAHIKLMAENQQKARDDATKVEFGEFARPHSKILNQWHTLGFPAEQMVHMNAAGMGKTEDIVMYFDINNKPMPKALLLALCKSYATTDTDKQAVEWEKTDYAQNMIPRRALHYKLSVY